MRTPMDDETPIPNLAESADLMRLHAEAVQFFPPLPEDDPLPADPTPDDEDN